ncbi:hypothetical protein [Acinetobacter sp.]|uniref:hypothetical protein n=1 Tax=Acinetobacter sp. TaxID=472 RepID=UPI000C092459|nr:hypothetical protein [Acinetobacter sp.]MAK30293.1 hypothetical protein [Acinetobacter sp.]
MSDSLKLDKDLRNLALFAEMNDMITSLYLTDKEAEYKDALAEEDKRRWNLKFEQDKKISDQANLIKNQEFTHWYGQTNFHPDGSPKIGKDFNPNEMGAIKLGNIKAATETLTNFYNNNPTVAPDLTADGEIDIDKGWQTYQTYSKGQGLGFNFSADSLIPQDQYKSGEGLFQGVDILSPGFFSSNDIIQSENWLNGLRQQSSLTENDINILTSLGFFEDGGPDADSSDLNQLKADDPAFWSDDRKNRLNTIFSGFKSTAMATQGDYKNPNYLTGVQYDNHMNKLREHGINVEGSFWASSSGKALKQKLDGYEQILQNVPKNEDGIPIQLLNIKGTTKQLDLLDEDSYKQIQKGMDAAGLDGRAVKEFLLTYSQGNLNSVAMSNWARFLDASGNIKVNTPLANLKGELEELGQSQLWNAFYGMLQSSTAIDNKIKDFGKFMENSQGNIPSVVKYRTSMLEILDNQNVPLEDGTEVSLRHAIIGAPDTKEGRIQQQQAMKAFQIYAERMGVPDEVFMIYLEKVTADAETYKIISNIK